MGSLITDVPHSEVTATLEILDRLGVDREGLKRFRKASQREQRKIACMIQNGLNVVPVPRSQNTLTDLITAGRYDLVDENITEENFPMPSDFVFGEELKLFRFDRTISSENAIKEMEKEGYRPATIWDLLDYGFKNPEMQRQFPIVALGSAPGLGDDRHVAYLDGSDSGRYLNLRWFDYDWDGVYRFLAVRN